MVICTKSLPWPCNAKRIAATATTFFNFGAEVHHIKLLLYHRDRRAPSTTTASVSVKAARRVQSRRSRLLQKITDAHLARLRRSTPFQRLRMKHPSQPVPFEVLQKHFHLPLAEVSQELGVHEDVPQARNHASSHAFQGKGAAGAQGS